MCNGGVIKWAKKHRDKLAGRVLEVGSFNVNGSVRDVLPIDVGIDIREGPDVDIVANASTDLLDLFGVDAFDAVIASESMEHIEDWRGALREMWAVLKPDGWLAITVPTLAKGRHGYPSDYWRWDDKLVNQVWPGTKVDKTWDRGIAWIVQKTGPLPDLDAVHLHPVK